MRVGFQMLVAGGDVREQTARGKTNPRESAAGGFFSRHVIDSRFSKFDLRRKKL
jgi:hypothetical protein